MSENDWTNNIISIKWFKQCFESQTRNIKNEQRLLIVDDHDLYFINEIIRFYVAYKIILLYLFSYFIDFLQSLNVRVFNLFTYYYRKRFWNIIKYDKYYNVDQINFLKFVQTIKHEEITSINIEFVWRKVELVLFNSNIVLTKFSKLFASFIKVILQFSKFLSFLSKVCELITSNEKS